MREWMQDLFSKREHWWILFGLIGQIMFTGRFVVQWIASEKAKKSVVTRSFWMFSILGSSVLSIYAIYRKDPVFILGQVPGLFIYARNLMIMKKEEHEEATIEESAVSTEAQSKSTVQETAVGAEMVMREENESYEKREALTGRIREGAK
ncbi:lipid-A-disaccharide synthase N-terminal domain-containing protein [Paenibacillus sp. HB172176]|uniref:lipid-A-disaccharide synthase N-terminal domain-containing protein n=1 Tax=Paenibacillus sp. HB172176 TaxID=2493690 RepID=UPI00143C1446|nr:lipid-A-disaccharide synthase N-terminal domain-containing protein [Paenibacillus sp. HB172176]